MSGRTRTDAVRSALGEAQRRPLANLGSNHWWGQRLTALCLVPLSLWFIWSVIHLSGASHQVVTTWMSSSVILSLMLVFIIATFYHLQLGLQVVIEDYVHGDLAKWGSVLAVKAASVFLALVCIVSVLKIGL